MTTQEALRIMEERQKNSRSKLDQELRNIKERNTQHIAECKVRVANLKEDIIRYGEKSSKYWKK